ncbi:RNA exonuclease 1 homolog [Ctenocephalides felis]|uniref:RNA exonuclease 1 homolog n=1 Tax=Ctenocephalides felis TaxID=7515 RepID=UPI000E6E1129|nr:RNA exonuclease 1 homolog [Ctenocephalides felis]
MLPSSGLFKHTICPHYKDSSVNCQRPYCHFLHTKNDNLIEHLNDPVIKEALLSKQYHNVLRQIKSGAFQGAELQPVLSQPEKPKDCKYNPTPISKLKTDKLGLHDYVPSVISDDKKSTELVKRKSSPKLLHYIPSVCKSSEDKNNVVSYTPTSSKKLNLNENKYEPRSASNQEDKTIDKTDYKPSSSAQVKKNENTYEPLNTNVLQQDVDNDKTHTYKPSLHHNSNKNSNIYEPHGTSSSSIEYQPSPEKSQKRSSTSILNEISNLSDEKQLSIKKPKLDINFDNLEAEFNIIDEILNGNDCKSDESKSHQSERSNKEKHEKGSKSKHDKDNKSKSKSSSSKSTSSKSSSHHHKSSHSHKSKSASSTKIKKDESKSNKNCDKKDSHQSKSKHDSKSKSHSKSSSENKIKNKDSSYGDKSSRSRKTNEIVEKNSSPKANLVGKGYSLFESDDEELDHPVNSTDLKDPIVLECLKISEEYNNSLENNFQNSLKDCINDKEKKSSNVEIPEVAVTTKKRIAHSLANTIIRPAAKLVKKFTPATSFVERYKKILESQKQKEFEECEKRLEELTNSTKPIPISTTSASSKSNYSITNIKSSFASIVNDRPTLSKPIPVRIAHTPKSQNSDSSTMQTLKKGTVRTAHVPKENVLKKLDATNLLGTNNSKIPSNVRLAYLNYITEACLEMHKNDVEKAHKMGQEEELAVVKKCMNIKVYKNSCLATILKIRKATKELQNSTNGMSSGSLTIPLQYEKLSKAHRYNLIKKWILTEEDLETNSYPMPTSTIGIARINNDKAKLVPEDRKIRQCSRCPKEYSVDDDGIPLVREACIYHPRRCYKTRGRSIYGCCGLELGSIGCSSGDHVIEGIIGPGEGLRTGFVQTLKKPPGHSANDSIYALDCEMVYTTKGIELARITVVNDDLDVVYDRFVKPENSILDYATTFSGITAEMLKDVTTTIFQVQAVLLNMFSDTTILVGHSLESDLKALKIVHKFVVDTSILFPHKAGLPFKRALKTLATEYLQKIIQESGYGHDSAEDARISMELVIWKVKESFKTQ